MIHMLYIDSVAFILKQCLQLSVYYNSLSSNTMANYSNNYSQKQFLKKYYQLMYFLI